MQKVHVKQVRSQIGRCERQRATLRGLGLGQLNRERTLSDSAAVRGMLAKVSHLVEWRLLSEDGHE